MSVLHEFLGIRRAVALWEGRADTQLGALHGLGFRSSRFCISSPRRPAASCAASISRARSRSRRRG